LYLSAECLDQADPQDDLKATLHPRSTGLLFILRTLLPSLPDLQLMDVTIGYPGVPFTTYPQDYFGLLSIFFRSVPPPTVHLHLHIHSDLGNGEIPSLITPEEEVRDDTGLATTEEARGFELWLRGKWEEKDKRMEGFARDQKFGDESEVVPIRQVYVPFPFRI
jgi:lysocardiolipin and lysophospholipid acyltransferase